MTEGVTTSQVDRVIQLSSTDHPRQILLVAVLLALFLYLGLRLILSNLTTLDPDTGRVRELLSAGTAVGKPKPNKTDRKSESSEVYRPVFAPSRVLSFGCVLYGIEASDISEATRRDLTDSLSKHIEVCTNQKMDIALIIREGSFKATAKAEST